MVMTTMVISALAAIGTSAYNMTQQAAIQDKQDRLHALEQSKKTRQQIAQARMASAEVENRGATSGTLMSSGVMGGEGSVESQMASNLGYLTETGAISDSIRKTQGKINFATNVGSAVKSVAGAFSDSISGMSTTNSLFNMANDYNQSTMALLKKNSAGSSPPPLSNVTIR